MYLGIEIGGTKLQAALGRGDGRLERLVRVAARPEQGRAGICEQSADLVRRLLCEAGVAAQDLDGCGIGFGGPVDSLAGRTILSNQVAGWENFPLVEWLRSELDIAACLGNDSDLAGLAEARHGAGRGRTGVVYMNIGSGIGGAIVIANQLYRGQGVGAAEIGQLRILPGAPGQPWRTLESLCSGWSLAAQAHQAATAHPQSLLATLARQRPENAGVEVLAEAVRQGDPVAADIWNRAVERLGVAIANVITLLHPACFVLGGGVAQVGDLLLEPLRAEVARQVFAPFADSYEIVPAELGEEVVLHGSIEWARERL